MKKQTLKWSISQSDIDAIVAEKLVPESCGARARNSVPRKEVTTEIFADLMDLDLIKDPFMDTNEIDVQWVGQRDWTYESSFQLSSELDFVSVQQSKVLLMTEGLDTFTVIKVNGSVVARTDNMFKGNCIDITEVVREGQNSMEILFECASRKGRELEKRYGKLPSSNGDPSRVYVRKAQYHYGWDWGPVIMTCGPYKPVNLVVIADAHDNAFEDVYVNSEVDLYDDFTGAEKAHLQVEISLLKPNWTGKVRVKISEPERIDCRSYELQGTVSEGKQITLCQTIESPTLWELGTLCDGPYLYNVEVHLYNEEDQLLDTRTIKHGFRKVELIQEPLNRQTDSANVADNPKAPNSIPGSSTKGKSFYFRVNGIDHFTTGSCWIPAHSLTTRLTHDDYKAWLKLASESNHSMLRVWGGGLYEDDSFYDVCDELGIMVWQDFMFACGIYPANITSFYESVKEEAIYQLKRLRNHPCIVIYAGNNEDYQIAESHKLGYNPSDKSNEYLDTKFPARQLYEVLFPRLIKELSPNTAYIPGSPWGQTDPNGHVNDQYVGDIHQWNVWHGTQEKYQDWYKLGGRFVSEFGMEAMPCKKTILDFVSDESQLYAQSRVVEHHNKALGFERRLGLYVMENVAVGGMNMSLDNWVYATQLVQAECIAQAIRQWKRQWGVGGRRHIGGALVWQLNDCWPVASWSLVDYYKRPKLAYYAFKREAKYISVGIQRYSVVDDEEKDIDFGDNELFDYRKKHIYIDIWMYSEFKAFENDLFMTLYIYSASSGEVLAEKHMTIKEALVTEATELVTSISLGTNKDEITDKVVYCRLDSNEGLEARTSDWPQPLKHLVLKDRGLSYEIQGQKIIFTTKKPVKGVYIIYEGNDSIFFEDNGFDLFPNEAFEVKVRGEIISEKLQVTYYQKDLQTS